MACFVAAGGALVTGDQRLSLPSPLFSIPWGNLVAAAMIASLPLAALALIRGGRLLWPARIVAGFVVIWLPVSMAMAGNIYLNDFGALYGVFQAYSAACVVLPLLLGFARLVEVVLTNRV